MHCQLHRETEAASVCVSCGRALCRDCQKTTRDERTICGLPQCEEFVKRQAAVQVAVRQTCANNADAQLLMAGLFRSMALAMFILSAGMVFVALVAAGFSWASGFANIEFVPILLVLTAAVFFFLGSIFQRLPPKFIAQARNWEDISRDFDQRADVQAEATIEVEARG